MKWEVEEPRYTVCRRNPMEVVEKKVEQPGGGGDLRVR